MIREYEISKSKIIKCIILDCDNVLWRGCIIEDGAENYDVIEYKTFQKVLAKLYEKGIILALCTKNDENDILDMFERHHTWPLTLDKITIIRANWDNKVKNIQDICEYTGIGYENMLFIDDSLYEISLVQEHLPAVNTIRFDNNNVIKEMKKYVYSLTYDKASIIARNETYRTNKLRNELRKSVSSKDEYIKMLNTQITMKEAHVDEYRRISELTLRANKCTNGKRYSVNELRNVYGKTNKSKLYSIYAKDKYADFGLVGAIGLHDKEIELFVISCRILGRDIENIIISDLIKEGVSSISWKHTKKNNDLYKKIDERLDVKYQK